jgi:hypothetical protein
MSRALEQFPSIIPLVPQSALETGLTANSYYLALVIGKLKSQAQSHVANKDGTGTWDLEAKSLIINSRHSNTPWGPSPTSFSPISAACPLKIQLFPTPRGCSVLQRHPGRAELLSVPPTASHSASSTHSQAPGAGDSAPFGEVIGPSHSPHYASVTHSHNFASLSASFYPHFHPIAKILAIHLFSPVAQNKWLAITYKTPQCGKD